jgi:transcription elongation factor GreB
MSKAFTREGDDPLDGVLQVDDAALPPGEKNYLTPEGAARLRDAIARLREAPRGDPRRKVEIDARLAALLRRLEVAEVIDPALQPRDRVVFGATVTVRDEDGRERSYRIVGVDEADPKRGWISWRTPIARALLDRPLGETVTLRTPGGEVDVEIVGIGN